MTLPTRHTIRFAHASAAGAWWVLVDVDAATISWRGGEPPQPLSGTELAHLCELADAVRPEHATLQPCHITYAQDESLEIVRGDERCLIDASNGEICAGPPGALVEALHAAVRTRRPGS